MYSIRFRQIFLASIVVCKLAIPAGASTLFYVSNDGDGTIQAIGSATGVAPARLLPGLLKAPWHSTMGSERELIRSNGRCTLRYYRKLRRMGIRASLRVCRALRRVLAFYNGYLFAGVNNTPNLNGLGTIIKIASDGSTSSYASSPTLGPDEITFDSGGNLYVASGGNFYPSEGEVNKIDSSGNVTPYANILAPFGATFGGSGNLYVSSSAVYSMGHLGGSYEIFAVAPSGTVTDITIGNNDITGLAYNGNSLYGCDGDTTNSIVSISATGAVSTFATGLNAPDYILTVPEPNILPELLLASFSFLANRRIRLFQ